MIKSYQRRIRLVRSLAGLWLQSLKASFAASMARQVSFAPIRGTVPRISPVAGLFTSMVAPLSASHQRPPMYACCRKRSESCRESVVVITAGLLGKIARSLSSESAELRIVQARSRRKSQKAIANCLRRYEERMNIRIYVNHRYLLYHKSPGNPWGDLGGKLPLQRSRRKISGILSLTVDLRIDYE